MRLALLFGTVGTILIVLQMSILHLLPFGPVVPDLVLVLCVYLGVYHPTVGAALGSFALGYSVDVLSSPILGINAFAMSSVFLAVYLGARTIWLELHNLLLSAFVVFAASLVKSAALILIWALFLSVDGLWSGAVRYVVTEALLAAVLAPLFFLLLQRGQALIQPPSATRE